jgi:hypothetical protein
MRTGYTTPNTGGGGQLSWVNVFFFFGGQDTVNVAKQCAALAAQVILPEPTARLSFVEHLLALPQPDTLWHIRAAMLPFLQYATAAEPIGSSIRPWSVTEASPSARWLSGSSCSTTSSCLGRRQRSRSASSSFLCSPTLALRYLPPTTAQRKCSDLMCLYRPKVRELASGSLSSLLHGEEDALMAALAQRFLATLGDPLRRRNMKDGMFVHAPATLIAPV